ncbi:MAG: AAA family ATPase [Candidatus Omnitrophica bacterium]|nr:AAA family ATPase [Candidatus Omnitrophota bacterium]
MASFELKGVSFQDVRCFHGEVKIAFKNPTIFVGANDTGKSSIFKILDIFFNHIEVKGKEEISLSKESIDYLMPKYCERRHSSRRVIVEVGASDRRLLRGCSLKKTGTAFIILTITQKGTKLEINRSHRGVKSDRLAVSLYKKLKEGVRFAHIPSLRDVSSDVFKKNLSELFKSKILEQINPSQAGGTTAEYRNTKSFINQYRGDLENLANGDLLNVLRQNIPLSVSQDISFIVDIDAQEVLKLSLDWIKLVRPARENESINMLDIGTGALSSLSLAVLLTNKVSPGHSKVNIIAVEEPEAFVHPHYQRSLFGRLLNNAGESRLLVSTHSPAIIDRQPIGNISIVTRESPAHGSRIWQIGGEVKDVDKEIFSAHANFANSELFFSDLVVLVEGPSEKLVLTYLFDKLPEDLRDVFSGVSIIEVGGNAHYGPFIRLLKSFSKSGKEQPIKWWIFTDGDSVRPGNDQPVIRALRDSGYAHLDYAQLNLALSTPFVDDSDALQRVRKANEILRHGRCFTNLADLEYSLLNSKNFLDVKRSWRKELKIGLIPGELPSKLGDALSYIGSKGLNLNEQRSETGKKPFIHGKIMRWTKLNKVSEIFKDFLKEIALELLDEKSYQKFLTILNEQAVVDKSVVLTDSLISHESVQSG